MNKRPRPCLDRHGEMIGHRRIEHLGLFEAADNCMTIRVLMASMALACGHLIGTLL